MFTRWAQGYNGSPALFVNRDTVCFICGNNIKFVNTKDKRESVLSSPGDGIGAFAVNSSTSSIAFAELRVNPKLFIYTFPDFSRPRAVLEGKLCFLIITYYSCSNLMSRITRPKSCVKNLIHKIHEQTCDSNLT